MASQKSNLRQKSVIDAKVQWTLAFRVVLHFSIFICAGTVLGIINQVLDDPFCGFKEHLSRFWNQSGPMLLALVCLMPIFIRDTLTLSNRIAGPIHNLQTLCQKLADGENDVEPLKFRKHDMWQDLPGVFNTMAARLSNGESTVGTDTADAVPTAAAKNAAVPVQA